MPHQSLKPNIPSQPPIVDGKLQSRFLYKVLLVTLLSSSAALHSMLNVKACIIQDKSVHAQAEFEGLFPE